MWVSRSPPSAASTSYNLDGPKCSSLWFSAKKQGGHGRASKRLQSKSSTGFIIICKATDSNGVTSREGIDEISPSLSSSFYLLFWTLPQFLVAFRIHNWYTCLNLDRENHEVNIERVAQLVSCLWLQTSVFWDQMLISAKPLSFYLIW